MGVMNSGVKQWVFQRVSNAFFVSFGVALLCTLVSIDDLNFQSLKELITASGFTYYFALVLLLACINSVLAAWQIDGDYANKFGIPNFAITVITMLGSLAFLFYGLNTIFS